MTTKLILSDFFRTAVKTKRFPEVKHNGVCLIALNHGNYTSTCYVYYARVHIVI